MKLTPQETARNIYAKEKRHLALQLGVDPYSTNPQLQEALNEVARNKNRGKLVARVGTAAIPYAGLGLGIAQTTKGLQERLALNYTGVIQKGLIAELRRRMIRLCG